MDSQQISHELDLDDQEITFCEDMDNQQTDDFNTMVGLLEELLISEDFELLQSEYIREKCKEFTESGENLPHHMLIFKEYQQRVEQFIENVPYINHQKVLRLQIPNFTMKSFLTQIAEKNEEIDEQILETLLSFSDYQLFKEIMVEQRIRVEEEERTIKKKTNKATQKGQKSANSGNIFQPLTNDFQGLQITNSKQGNQQKSQNPKQAQQQFQDEEIVETLNRFFLGRRRSSSRFVSLCQTITDPKNNAQIMKKYL